MRSSFSSLLIGVFLLFFLRAGHALAQHEKEEIPKEPGIAADLMRTNQQISAGIITLAEELDLFLTGEKLTDKRNETNVVVQNATYSAEGEGLENSTHLKVNLRLPNLEKHWELRFTTYDENEEERGIKRRYFRETPRETNYGASLGLFRRLGKVKTTFRPRVELKDPLHISYVLRFEALEDFKTWAMRPKLEFFARPDQGTGVYANLNFSFPVSDKVSFTLINDGEYEDKLNKFTTSNGFSFGQTINEYRALSYSLIFSSDNRPEYHLEQYSAAISWNHLYSKKVLEYSITPSWGFAKEHSFKGQVGIAMVINLIF